jgi:hypothetical protein
MKAIPCELSRVAMKTAQKNIAGERKIEIKRLERNSN